jgi:hypothetical protein
MDVVAGAESSFSPRRHRPPPRSARGARRIDRRRGDYAAALGRSIRPWPTRGRPQEPRADETTRRDQAERDRAATLSAAPRAPPLLRTAWRFRLSKRPGRFDLAADRWPRPTRADRERLLPFSRRAFREAHAIYAELAAAHPRAVSGRDGASLTRGRQRERKRRSSERS